MSGTSAMKFNPIMKILMTVEYRFGRFGDGFSYSLFSLSCDAKQPLPGCVELNLWLRSALWIHRSKPRLGKIPNHDSRDLILK